ncbi:aminoglycoside phosphotransferase [Kitasatospora sp. MMS16-BH015]|uniref:aminoglycoside phosphotransferase family protein n=1 Tax=Kitasatospora sp. MMS16-BH015 TaxID=2018025 RepID=UPI000CA147A8|nr:aminoglycoside phosphotransferase family protein [Kitasatospora sp. MMS16-BH015]AUG75196.1 aminoglycoside phosphotransferase [Kitasatospora sp. MMS16-BH015]
MSKHLEWRDRIFGDQPPLGDRLHAELGAPRRARRLFSSQRSRVWQAELAGGPVVVKQLLDGPAAADRYRREVTALRLAAPLDPPLVPRLLGADEDRRVLVLEHLPHHDHRRLPEGWQVDYAAALARLHSVRATEELPRWSGPTERDVDAFLRLAEALGIAAPATVRSELDALLDRLGETTATGTDLLHGDPCPGNDLHTPAGVRFIDFEQAARGSGIVELAYLRIGFPTCGFAMAPAPGLLDAAEAAYRSSWREATGTDLTGDLTDACAAWLLRGDALVRGDLRGTTDQLARIPTEDWTWGNASARQRLLHRLRVVGHLAGPALPTFGLLATALHAELLHRWPKLTPLPPDRPHP